MVVKFLSWSLNLSVIYMTMLYVCVLCFCGHTNRVFDQPLWLYSKQHYSSIWCWVLRCVVPALYPYSRDCRLWRFEGFIAIHIKRNRSPSKLPSSVYPSQKYKDKPGKFTQGTLRITGLWNVVKPVGGTAMARWLYMWCSWKSFYSCRP